MTTTAGYGVLVYAYAVLLAPMEVDLGASRTAVAAGQTLAMVAGALTAVVVGRFLDRWGGRLLMPIGSLLATAGLLAWSRVETVAELYLVTMGVGVASACVLYEAAFAVVLRFFGPERRGTAILMITIVGGFASTIFFPLTGFLVEAYGWRQALVVLAVIYGGLTFPLHLLIRRPPVRTRTDAAPEGIDTRSEDSEAPESATVPESAAPTSPTAPVARADELSPKAARRMALRDRAYWLIGTALLVEGAANAVISLHLVTYLVELGHRPAFAATVAGLLGLLSVTGRLVTTVLQRRRRLTVVVGLIFLVQAAGAAMLPAVGGSVIGAMLCIVAFGIGMGVSTIAKPVLVAERYPLQVYASLAGVLAGLMLVSKAFAPLGAAVLYTVSGGYLLVMVLCALACVIGAAALFRVRQPAAVETESDVARQQSG